MSRIPIYRRQIKNSKDIIYDSQYIKYVEKTDRPPLSLDISWNSSEIFNKTNLSVSRHRPRMSVLKDVPREASNLVDLLSFWCRVAWPRGFARPVQWCYPSVGNEGKVVETWFPVFSYFFDSIFLYK